MTDLSEFEALNKRHACPLSDVFEALDSPAFEKLAAAFKAEPYRVSADAIAKWCRLRKHEVSRQQVVSHRNGTCSCYRHER